MSALAHSRISIRAVTRADVPMIRGLLFELAVFERIEKEFRATDRGLRKALFAKAPRLFALVACSGREVVGVATYYLTYSTFSGAPNLFIEDLFVKPEFRNRGIGRRLLARLASEARRKLCNRMEWIALDWNEPALTFYKSIGATPHKEWVIHRWARADFNAMR